MKIIQYVITMKNIREQGKMQYLSNIPQIQ